MAAHKKYKIIISKNISLKEKGEGCSIKQAPFVMNDNGLNMRIKVKRKSK